jgi:hypothetical protein
MFHILSRNREKQLCNKTIKSNWKPERKALAKSKVIFLRSVRELLTDLKKMAVCKEWDNHRYLI